ncbi:MAG: alpha/beta hydrolase [Flavobacteriaceae bacterium]|nr:alpha/beta hydrolase [Flavobacteriaceae bacterium]
MTFRESDKRIYKKFKKVNKTPQIYRENYKGKTVRYVSAKPIKNSLPTLLFIHGAPGSGDSFFRYLQDDDLSKKATIITLDRLGYGYSDYGNAETSIEKQAESIYTIIQKHKLNNVVLIGWSYGVPIAAKMAYKYPEIKHSVLVAGAISPEDEKFFGIAKVIQWKLTRWMFSKALKVADDEKMTHVTELTKMLNDWGKIKTPITYYHGTKDRIVPYKNMAFITTKVNDSLLNAITVKDANHFILFKNYGMVKKELLVILDYIDK